MPEIQLSDIQAAAERTRHIVRRTPVFTSRTFDALAGVTAFFKCENFQRGGAFKIRGAANFILSIPKDDLPRGVVTYLVRQSWTSRRDRRRGIGRHCGHHRDASRRACIEARGHPRPRRSNRHL